MKNCPVCGKQLPEEAGFCVYCMTRLEPVTRVSAAPPQRKGSKALVYALAAVVVALAVAVAALVLRGPEVVQIPVYVSSSDTGEAAEPTLDEKFAPVREKFIQSLIDAQKTRDFPFDSGFNQISYYSRTKDDASSSVYSHPFWGSGVVTINFAHNTDYVECEVLGVTDIDVGGGINGHEAAYGLMQNLCDVRTGTTGTAVYDFLRDDINYPFTSENANWMAWSPFCEAGWIESLTSPNAEIELLRKNTSLDGMSLTLNQRTRKYGDMVYYDMQFSVWR